MNFTPDQAFHFIWGIAVGIFLGMALAAWQRMKEYRR